MKELVFLPVYFMSKAFIITIRNEADEDKFNRFRKNLEAENIKLIVEDYNG